MCVISLYRSFRNRSTPPSNIFSLKLIKFLIFLCCQGCIPETAHHSNVVYPSFTNMPSTTGINFAHNSGAFGAHWLPETMGAGCCWLDYDGDGWQGLFFVNGRDWTEVEVNEFVAMAGSVSHPVLMYVVHYRYLARGSYLQLQCIRLCLHTQPSTIMVTQLQRG